MSESSEPTDQEAAQAAHTVIAYAAQLLREGKPPAEVERELVSHGLPPDVVHRIVERLAARGASAPASQLPVTGDIERDATEMTRRGMTVGDVADALVARGVDRTSAMDLACKVSAGMADRGGGRGGQVVLGAIICFSGIAVTAASYSAAADGGVYIVAWGAILVGGIRMLKALVD